MMRQLRKADNKQLNICGISNYGNYIRRDVNAHTT